MAHAELTVLTFNEVDNFNVIVVCHKSSIHLKRGKYMYIGICKRSIFVKVQM